jgi:hypothetical protein
MKRLFLLFLLMSLIPTLVYGIQVLPTDDVYTREDTAITNYNAEDRLFAFSRSVNKARESYLEFTIPQPVETAELSLYIDQAVNTHASVNISFMYCNDQFDEATLTWSNQAGTFTNCDADPFYSVVSTSEISESWFNLSIKDIINTDDDGTFTIKIYTDPDEFDGTGRQWIFNSTEVLRADYRPYINYTVANGTEIKARNIRTGSFYSNFTIYYKDLTNGTIKNASTGGDFINLVGLNPTRTYYINISSPNFAFAEANVTGNSTTYIFEVYAFNSIDITVFDEDTQTLLNGSNVTNTLYYTFNGTTNNLNNDTGYFYLKYLTAGNYELLLERPSYRSRYYYLALGDGTHISINAYLINSTVAQLTNLFVYCDGSARSNATISVYKLISGKYRTVAQRRTDATGQGPIYLNPSTTYRFIITDSIYGTYTKDITPSLSPISFDICGGGSQPYNWSNIHDKFTYLINPSSPVNQSLINFSLTATSPEGYINGFGFYVNSSHKVSLNSSASGGTLYLGVDLNGSSPVLPVYYWFNITGEEQFSFIKYYRVNQFSEVGNKSLIAIISDYEDNISPIYRYSTALFVAIFIMLMFYKVVNPQSNAYIGLAVLVAFGFVGWVSFVYVIPVGALLIAYTIYRGGFE